MALDLKNLEKAVTALDAAVSKSQEQTFINGLDETALNVFKAGVIQHFEFTYELCWKYMKRWLENNISPTLTTGITRRELFRHARENLLIDDIDSWMGFHEARNLTSHIYAADVAETIYSTAKNFAGAAKSFLIAIEQRND